MSNLRLFPLTAMCIGLLTACGGGGGDSPAPQPPATTSMSGSVADGYLQGAVVCLDMNNNGRCDSGEPSATTNANGAYEIKNVVAGDETKYSTLVAVPHLVAIHN